MGGVRRIRGLGVAVVQLDFGSFPCGPLESGLPASALTSLGESAAMVMLSGSQLPAGIRQREKPPNALDPRLRSGRCVTNGHESHQQSQPPDFREADFCRSGFKSILQSVTESTDSTRISHKSTVQDSALCVTPVNPPTHRYP